MVSNPVTISDAPRAGTVHRGRLVQLVRDGAQRRVQQDHVVPDELPGDDVGQAAEHPPTGQEPGSGQVQCPAQLGEGAVVRPVQVTPHERGDHAGHRVRDEDTQPHQTGEAQQSTVEREREQQRQQEHHRYLDDEEGGDPQHPVDQLRVPHRVHVVRQAHEGGTADQPVLEQAEIGGVAERCDEQQQEKHQERGDEQLTRPATATGCCGSHSNH
jgi:hypothetical protein